MSRNTPASRDSASRNSPSRDSASRHPSESPGTQTAESTALNSRAVAIVGNVIGTAALLVAISAIYWLLTFTASDHRISSVFEDDIAGTRTMSFPLMMLVLSMIGFFFGQFAGRGRWLSRGPASGTQPRAPSRAKSSAKTRRKSRSKSRKMSRTQPGSFQVTLRPISVAVHTLFFGVAVLAWAIVVVLPVYLDTRGAIAASDGSSAVEQF